MTKPFVVLALFTASASAFAANPVDKAIAKMKKTDVRTLKHVVTEAEADGACTSAGDTVVELQVRTATRQESNGTIAIGHTWETVKTVSISPDGSVTEVCAE